ncbi:MAG: hypothetical protein FJX76_18170, partial [Armatimonadetes bacterium]|nr:hypothetical protein [Armatimonadota bacterium]
MIARAAGWFALLTVVFYSPFLFGGRFFIPGDILATNPLWYQPQAICHNFDLFDAVIYFYPLTDYLNERLHQGEFPLWNPYNFAGHPVYADGQS